MANNKHPSTRQLHLISPWVPQTELIQKAILYACLKTPLTTFFETCSSLACNSQSSCLSFLRTRIAALMMTRTSRLFPETEDLNHLPLPLGKGHGYSKSYLEGVRLFLYPLFLAVLEINLGFACGKKSTDALAVSASQAPLLPLHILFPSVPTPKVSCHLRNCVRTAPFSFNGRLPPIFPFLLGLVLLDLTPRCSLMLQ